MIQDNHIVSFVNDDDHECIHVYTCMYTCMHTCMYIYINCDSQIFIYQDYNDD